MIWSPVKIHRGQRSEIRDRKSEVSTPAAEFQARAIAAVIVRSGTMAKCSVPFSSYEMNSEVFRVEKLMKSRCGISKIRSEAVSIRNGLFFAINSSTREGSIADAILRQTMGFCHRESVLWRIGDRKSESRSEADFIPKPETIRIS